MGRPVFSQSAALHFTYQDRSTVFEDIGLWTGGRSAVTGGDEARNEPWIGVTEGTFRVLRAQPVLGRSFTPEDDAPGAPPTVVLGHGYWQNRFGADPSVVGQTIRVAGTVREIIGVMPADFHILQNRPSFFLPLGIDRSMVVAGQFIYRSVARLVPGATIETATAELTNLVPTSLEMFPGGMTESDIIEWGFVPLLRPLKWELVRDVANLLWVLLGMAGVVLLIACANVANLSLVRAEGRDREMAIRTAIGASRARIVGQSLTEGLAIGVLGGLLGVGLAETALRALKAFGLSILPRLNEVSLDPLVLLFALSVSILAGTAIGLFPALRHLRSDAGTALKEGTSGAGVGRRRHRTRNALAVTQVALAMVLLVGSGLMFRSFQTLRNVDPGFGNPHELLTLRIAIPTAEITDVEEVGRTHELLAQTLLAIPGVTGVGLTSKLPMGIGTNLGPVFVEEFPLPDGVPAPPAQSNWIGGDYFATLQIPMVAGRAISWSDPRQTIHLGRHLRPLAYRRSAEVLPAAAGRAETRRPFMRPPNATRPKTRR